VPTAGAGRRGGAWRQHRKSERSTVGRIVVGVDGSEGSRLALLWAAGEAALRGASLEVIHTYEPVQDVGSTGSAAQAEKLFGAAREAARELVDGMTVAIADVEVEGHALESLNPAQRWSNARARRRCWWSAQAGSGASGACCSGR
jgi:nucleotide-binding universal stress UspA family protein